MKKSIQQEIEEYVGCRRRRNLSEDGWHLWSYSPPPNGVLIQVTRADPNRDEIFITTVDDMPREANAWGLYWRLTGIGKMQMEPKA